MEKVLNLNGKLDFEEIDLTPPDKVIEGILNQLPKETNGIISGKIVAYEGNIFSDRISILSGLQGAFKSVDKLTDVQSSLGEIGGEKHKFECFLYTPEYDKYKYRMFFAEYGIANYPVSIVLEESIAENLQGADFGYVYRCSERRNLEELMVSILRTKRIVQVMQELIRINQVKKKEDKI